MRKILLLCLLMVSMTLSAQISLGVGSTNVGPAPISSYYGYSYVQQIFTKQEINASAAGNITGLKFYLDSSASLANSSNWTVYVGHTSKTNFTSDNDWVPSVQMTQVFSGTVVNMNGVVQITFTTPFAYNNTDNLVVAAKESDSDYDGGSEAFYVYDSSPGSSLYFRSDFTNPNLAAPPFGNLNDEKSVITIDGLTANITPACPTVTYPGNNSTFIPVSPDIMWTSVQGATSYKISVGTTLGGTDVVNQQSVTTNNFMPSTPFNMGTSYYVKVIAVSASGESVGCSDVKFTTTPPIPANDDCSSATVLTVNPDMGCGNITSGYTLGASDSGLAPDPCNGTPDDDVWFKFVATATTHVISLSNIVSVGNNDSTDTYFQVLSGACGSLTSILCSDPESSLVSGLTVGDTYYVRVYSYSSGDYSQSFDICVGTLPPPPANDDCSAALVVPSFPYTYNQTDGAGATNNAGMITVCVDNDMNDGTWFKFTGNGNNVEITVTMPPGSTFDPQIGVYSGTCGSLSCEDTVDDSYEGGTETITIPTLAGNTYYVNIGNYSGFSDEMEDAFTITMTTDALGTSEVLTDKNTLKVYPNPFAEVLHISDIRDVKTISVTDMSGRLLKTIDNPSSELYLSDLKSGMYIVTLFIKDGAKQVAKVIKK
ncbi:T9SS type A sorting domain-containing protein [Chryseobacterium sp. FH2]|uniref:T9SS type A sorting domain-containing protein n=1 Tax=Chryseobacterium sp. FH2 TaxID=1674291 RepID=UPI0009E25652|nr:T9SS type A sorting domain-containing protein [Chryseobacterium sp. FH2]